MVYLIKKHVIFTLYLLDQFFVFFFRKYTRKYKPVGLLTNAPSQINKTSNVLPFGLLEHLNGKNTV